MVIFPAEGDVLARHVIKCAGYIPGFERISRIAGEIRRARSCGRAVDGRQQHQIATRIIQAATANRERIAVLVKPKTVIQHGPHEALLGARGRIAKTAYAAAALASYVASERKGHLVEEP